MEVNSISREQVIKNSFWKFLESVGVQIVQLVVTIILARLLGPNEYGLMALVLVSVNFLGLFVNSSIASYLIFIKDIRKQEFFTALVSNLIVSGVLFIILFLSSSKISIYYNAPQLSQLLKVMAIVLPLNSISAIYNAYAQKMSLFRALFIRNMIALPTSGFLALIAAFCGLGVWALVIQQLTYSILLCIIVIITIKINIEGVWKIEIKQIIPMFRYGAMVLFSSIIAFVSDNISDLLIGKRLSSKQLGFYNRGNHFPFTIISVINNVVAGVLFPAFATYNTNLKNLKSKFSKSVRVLYYVALPILIGMAACSEPLVKVVLSDKWLQSIPVIQIICLYYCALPFLQASSQITLASGRLKLRTIGEIIKMVLTIFTLFYFIDYGIVAVAFSRLLVNIVLIIVTVIINKRIMGYGFIDFIKDIYKPIFLCCLMTLCIYPLVYAPINDFITLIIQIVLGLLVYLTAARFLHLNEVFEIVSMAKNSIKGEKQ